MLRSGFDTVINENIKYLLLDTFDIEYNLDDIKNFKIEVHEKFCKLIGSKEELEKVISKYEIDYPILYYNKQYSVAFNGPLFRKIKENYKDIIKWEWWKSFSHSLHFYTHPQARGESFEGKNPFKKLYQYSLILLPLLVSVIQKVENLTLAMEEEPFIVD